MNKNKWIKIYPPTPHEKIKQTKTNIFIYSESCYKNPSTEYVDSETDHKMR